MDLLTSHDQGAILWPWLTQTSFPIPDQTLALILIFVFAVIALLVLPGALFIRLVELIVSNGYRLVQLEQAVQQVLTHLSGGKEPSTSSLPPENTPTTLGDPSGTTEPSTPVTEYPKPY